MLETIFDTRVYTALYIAWGSVHCVDKWWTVRQPTGYNCVPHQMCRRTKYCASARLSLQAGHSEAHSGSRYHFQKRECLRLYFARCTIGDLGTISYSRHCFPFVQMSRLPCPYHPCILVKMPNQRLWAATKPGRGFPSESLHHPHHSTNHITMLVP